MLISFLREIPLGVILVNREVEYGVGSFGLPLWVEMRMAFLILRELEGFTTLIILIIMVSSLVHRNR